MSTLPGLASKGEKGKAKFQSLDINNLYRVSRGESLEKQQQKSTLPFKHGMQSLGRVPSARRPPANLPSIKSEHSGTDAAVSLVPSGGPGWGKQESSTPLTTATLQTPTTPTSSNVSSPSSTNTTMTPHQAAIALPMSTAIPPPVKHTTPAVPAATDKSWSSVMASNDLLHPPPYQSPQFQHEFPSLSAGDGVAPRPGTDTQYGPGPSLRPQTEGSWMQGGSRASADGPSRSSSAPLGAPPQLSAQVGLQQTLPPQFHGILPGFMFRGNQTPNGHGTSIANMPSPMLNVNRNRDGRPPGQQQQQTRSAEPEEVARRPIIKEEDLNRMDDMTKDMGWAAQDEIDYNQKLAFSDEESAPDKISRKMKPDKDEKTERQQESEQQKGWNRVTSAPTGRRATDEDEILAQKRRQQHQVIVNAAERAKQRKEEEEKKLKSKREKEQEEANATTIQSAGSTAVPEWEKEKERPKSDEEKLAQNKSSSHDNDFRQLTSIEGRSFIRKETRGGDNRNGPGYSRQMQNLPPRLQKKQQMRNNPSPQPPLSYAPYDSRWQPNQSLKPPVNQRSRNDWEESDKDEKGKYDEMRRRPYSDSNRKSDTRFDEYDYKKEKDEKWEKKDKFVEKEELKFDNSISRQSSEEWHNERHEKYEKMPERYERPQRPDSRDSRTSRDSRHSRDSARDSEPREHLGSWAESISYDEKRKEREDRRPIPGPITKEKIEADEKQSEKRNLTQLKKGNLPDKKIEANDDKDRTKEIPWNNNQIQSDLITDSKSLWADDVSTLTDIKLNQEKEKTHTDKSDTKDETKRTEPDLNKEKEDKRPTHSSNRNRPARSQGWDRSGSMFHNYKKTGRGSRSGRPSSKMGEFHATDSEGSVEDNAMNDFGKDDRGMQKSPKPARKNEKDEKNRDVKNDKSVLERKVDKYLDNKKECYEPRGEPSRHGRGGGNMRGRGGLSKRIDGYGPPPSKSPFGHSEEKEKKTSDDVHSESSFDIDSKGQNHAGVIGSSRKEQSSNMRGDKKHDDKYDRNKPRRDRDGKKNKPKSNENGDTSEHSDDSITKGRKNKSPIRNSRGISQGLRRNAPPRLSNDKRGPYNPPRCDNPPARQNSSNGSLRSVPPPVTKSEIKEDKANDANNALYNAIADISPNIKEPEEQQVPDGEIEDRVCNQGDSDGFQEVKSKKNVNKGPKVGDEKPLPRSTGPKSELKTIDRKPKQPYPLSQQQIANIPSLMDTPVNPPAIIPQPNKGQYDRNRHKLPPRLAKQRENSRLQKAQLQGICDMNDLNNVNQNINLYSMKDGPSNIPMTNAWEKPLGQLRSNIESEMVMPVVIENCKSIDQPHSPAQNSSPNNEKIIGKNAQIQDKSVLDGSTAPVNTIIFENTNYKSTPGVRTNRTDKPRPNKMEEHSPIDNSTVMSTFNKPVTDLLNKNDKQPDIQMQLSFNKEDTTDMKLDFFDSDISHLTEDKGSKNISLPRSMHAITSSNTTMSPSTADLNFKIASVKKVWDNSMPPVIEHSVTQEETSTFSSSFGPDPNSLDPSSAFSKAGDTAEDAHEGYSPSPSQNTANNTTNVCKVKPTQQVPGTTGQNIVGHQPHSAGIITMPPLSSPPIQPVIGPNIGLNQPPQQYTANQHLGYQAGLGGSTQFGMPAIPSPPNVLYNSTQQLQPNLYGGFPMDQLGGQRTSQFSQYPYTLGQNASSHYSAQSLYLQTQAHPPPAAQAPPDLYQSLTNYRLQNTAPYGQSQQLNNPTTVLISSTSNSLMSASVKPSNQQISAIGTFSRRERSYACKETHKRLADYSSTKTGGVGQTFQQQSQQGQQLYMAYDPSIQPNYLPNTGVMQRAPTGPVQNNVVQALQPSSSFYSGSTGGQTGYFQQPGSSTLQSGPLQQHQASYGLQGNVFGAHNQSHSSPNMQNISSHFLSQMQFAAAMNVQQFRNQNMQNASYLKGIGTQQVGDQSGRSQQLKSPGNQQEVLSSVFNSGPQIPSPKSRQNCKQPPPQPSPTTQHKYNLYQGVGSQQSSQTQRYPTPIQRPQINFQPNLNSVQNNSSNNQKHRTSNTKGPSRNYYSSQSSLSSQNDKVEENKLGDHGTQNAGTATNSAGNNANKTNMGGVSGAGVNKTEIVKEKEDSSAIKD